MPGILLTAWALAVGIYDLRLRRIPNFLTFGGAGVGIVFLLANGVSLLGASPQSAWSAGMVAFVVSLPFYRLGWLGAGDVKLMTAIGFLGGLNVLLTTFVLSSLLTLPVALWQYARIRLWRGGRQPYQRLPQGAFLAIGLILAMIGQMKPAP